MEVLGTRELHRRVSRGDLAAVAGVRELLREALLQWGQPELADTAELLVSELLTNALLHTGREAVCSVRLVDGTLYVEVFDSVPQRPRPSEPSERAQSGRGLILVQALADAWGVRLSGSGKAVWFELRTKPEEAPY